MHHLPHLAGRRQRLGHDVVVTGWHGDVETGRNELVELARRLVAVSPQGGFDPDAPAVVRNDLPGAVGIGQQAGERLPSHGAALRGGADLDALLADQQAVAVRREAPRASAPTVHTLHLGRPAHHGEVDLPGRLPDHSHQEGLAERLRLRHDRLRRGALDLGDRLLQPQRRFSAEMVDGRPEGQCRQAVRVGCCLDELLADVVDQVVGELAARQAVELADSRRDGGPQQSLAGVGSAHHECGVVIDGLVVGPWCVGAPVAFAELVGEPLTHDVGQERRSHRPADHTGEGDAGTDEVARRHGFAAGHRCWRGRRLAGRQLQPQRDRRWPVQDGAQFSLTKTR